MYALDPDLLQSPFFKITIKNIKRETSAPRPQQPITPGEFYIHKALLASLSPELQRHVNNDMSEGQAGMELNNVENETMKGFLQWAYTREYKAPNPEAPSSILYHTKLYALAERFKVFALSDVTYSKVTALLVDRGIIASREEISSVVSAIAYALETLPFSTVDASIPNSGTSSAMALSPSASALPLERLLRYFTQYSAWALDILRESREFMDLLSKFHGFALAVLVSTREAALPPWTLSAQPTLAIRPTPGNILQRRCTKCNITGVMKIECPNCKIIDGKTNNGPMVGQRITGTPMDYKYTCGSCNKTSRFTGEGQWGRDESVVGGIRYGHTYFLHCGNCDATGKDGKLDLC
ncbi:hypothetical protein BDZ91DRAFT_799123 [Kalaharituber pfeilii]|nr:hypothetical protein BDZ91DRAFT_799123 [Kalaharituber pfeilii]